MKPIPEALDPIPLDCFLKIIFLYIISTLPHSKKSFFFFMENLENIKRHRKENKNYLSIVFMT